MQKTTIQVSIVHDGTLDNRAAILDIQELAGKMAGVDVAHASGKGIKNLSEQGYKVFRARVCGITVEMAGDAHDGDIQRQVADVQATEVQCQGAGAGLSGLWRLFCPGKPYLESDYEKVYDYGIDFIVQWMYNSTNEEHGNT